MQQDGEDWCLPENDKKNGWYSVGSMHLLIPTDCIRLSYFFFECIFLLGWDFDMTNLFLTRLFQHGAGSILRYT